MTEATEDGVSVTVALQIIDLTEDLMTAYDDKLSTIFDVLAECKDQIRDEKRLKRDTYMDAYAMLGWMVQLLNTHAQRINDLAERYDHE